MLKNAGLDGYFTNHSLRRTCATRLFQGGAPVKLVKEITGHISDAVNKYQVTSDQQKMNASLLIQGDLPVVKLSEAPPMELINEKETKSPEELCKLPKLTLPVKINTDKETKEHDNCGEIAANVGNIVKSAVNAIGKRKAKTKH